MVCSTVDNSSPDSTTLQVLKVLLTAVASTKLRVHGELLLAVIKVCYNIALNSKSPINQATSKAMLSQMLSIIFRRMEADVVPSNNEPAVAHSEDGSKTVVEEVSSSDHNDPTITLGDTLSMKQINSTSVASQIFSGAQPLVGAMPYAQCYEGYQFGMWAGQLGDGSAITLVEILNFICRRWELHLKGAGKPPYSRFADGVAVLRSSIREFLCSEAMHFLGIPTTRALCLLTTGKYVTRDMFYDGNPKDEPGAIVCRVAQSFIRFG